MQSFPLLQHPVLVSWQSCDTTLPSDMYTILVCVLGILGTTIGGARYTRDTEADSCNQEELLEEVEKCASS